MVLGHHAVTPALETILPSVQEETFGSPHASIASVKNLDRGTATFGCISRKHWVVLLRLRVLHRIAAEEGLPSLRRTGMLFGPEKSLMPCKLLLPLRRTHLERINRRTSTKNIKVVKPKHLVSVHCKVAHDRDWRDPGN